MIHPSSVVVGVRQQREESRALDGIAELALVPGTGTRQPGGDDFARLGDEVFQRIDILVVNPLDFLGSEATELATLEQRALSVAADLLSLVPRRMTMIGPFRKIRNRV